MSFITFIKLLFNIKIWLSEKWDSFFPIKNSYCYYNNSINKISLLNNSKIYEKILIEYEINSHIYKIIYYNTFYNEIKKIPIDNIAFQKSIHKPILSLRIKINQDGKYKNISNIISNLKEYNQNTIFNDFIIFNITKYSLNKEQIFCKIYVKTLTKKFKLSYEQLVGKTIKDFYLLIK
jgi:hypothetical protein